MIALMIEVFLTLVPVEGERVPTAWCSAGDSIWAERGSTCHDNVAERQQAVCEIEDKDKVTHSVPCDIPPGYEQTMTLTPYDVPRKPPIRHDYLVIPLDH
jgi:hypothetical protein